VHYQFLVDKFLLLAWSSVAETALPALAKHGTALAFTQSTSCVSLSRVHSRDTGQTTGIFGTHDAIKLDRDIHETRHSSPDLQQLAK
jgi:hypothetical protein